MPSRLDIFRSDAQHIKEKWPDKSSLFKEFEISEQSFSFTSECNGKEVQFICCISEDYPENTFLSCREDPSRNKAYHVPLPLMLSQLSSELSCTEAMGSVVMTGSKPSTLREISRESAASSYADCHSDMSSAEEDECADYYHNDQDCDYADGTNAVLNPILETDIELCQVLFGDRLIQYRLFQSIDDIDVELHIPLSFIQDEVANAWRVKMDEPLIIRLHMSTTMYVDSTYAPKLEVFQPTKQSKCGVASQMRVIMETFISEQWKTLTNEKVKSASSGAHLPPSTKHSVTMSEIAGADPAAGVNDSSLAQLSDMGFPMDTARNALIITRGDISEATNLLLSNPDSCSTSYAVGSLSPQPSGSNQLTEALAALSINKTEPDRPVTQLSSPGPPTREMKRQVSAPDAPPMLHQQQKQSQSVKRFMGLKPKFNKKRSSNMVTSSTAPNLQMAASPSNIMTTDPQSWDGKNAKVLPTLEHGFLVQVYLYARQRIPTLNEYCVVCDEPHVFQNGAMLKPAVCSRELCVFAYQTLGVMADAAEDIATGAEVVDVLVAMAKAACMSPRKPLIFDPYPTVVDPKNPNELSLHPKSKDFDKVASALQEIFPMNEIVNIQPGDLKKEMDGRNSLSYPLLQWIITSNRSHIVKLPEGKQLSFMNTPHQFILLSSPPATEAIFRTEKRKYGSTFAFHGSHLENWHSIVRNGLMNASGTRFQMNGAAYGKGIYLSPSACVSFGYSGIYGANRAISKSAKKKNTEETQTAARGRFLRGKNINCIALCEVITSKELKKSGEVWVCPYSNHVCTRFFFLYDDGQVGQGDVNSQVEFFKHQILQACGHHASYV